jgi:hypothetical protein
MIFRSDSKTPRFGTLVLPRIVTCTAAGNKVKREAGKLTAKTNNPSQTNQFKPDGLLKKTTTQNFIPQA